ncbi:hypothetical protein [Oceanobacillus neutriphilus]|uniref:Uncharacterized protein n=1 Tax=Oceanobacillus neutriphilus TaxID=531815 RepID=A0ABQ2NQJ4_9BACI|nr:hypothetical protein [Oceanobacillus neutriphilus]GGP08733.1 hypothetical protein GCM10011346_10000 [Oceanobacillus neutriphilus]
MDITAIYVVGLFGVSTLEYLPWAFFSYITPLIVFLLVLLNIRVIPVNVDLEHGEKYDKSKHKQLKNANVPIKQKIKITIIFITSDNLSYHYQHEPERELL